MNPLESNAPMPGRRAFLDKIIKAGTASLVLGNLVQQAEAAVSKPPVYTVKDIMDIIKKEVPGGVRADTVDTIKAGDAGARVSAIVTTMFPTFEVIRQAIRLEANFIIAHEPTFYNNTDDRNWAGSNELVTQKLDLLNKHHITIWRCHDYWHATKPDSITYGVLKKADWLIHNPEGSISFSIPPASLQDIILHLKKTLGIPHVKFVGNARQICSRISLLPGAWGGQKQIGTIETDKPDLLIVGEVSEWETAEYVRDANLMGESFSLLILGHCLSEEPGMAYLAEWLSPRVPGIRITHIPSEEPFTWA